MKRFSVIAITIAFILAGCATGNLPSVCDNLDSPSVLCKMAAETGLRLEDIGNGLLVINAVAIGENVYTKTQAKEVVDGAVKVLDSGPISYLAFRGYFDKYVKYPGLVTVAESYMPYFGSTRIMYKADRDLLLSWLKNLSKTLA